MGTTRGRARWLARTIWMAVLAIAVFAVPAIASATPTAPTMRDATVTGGTNVTVWWSAPTDTPNGPFEYKLYRDDVPMTIATYASAELVTTTTDTTVTVQPAAGEAAAKYTYYYAVIARNTTTNTSGPISTNIAPNVHGGMRSGYPVYNCQLCHSVHGAPPEGYLGAATRYKCYRCHGNTDATKSYGDKAVRNVQKDFYDYTSGQTIPATASRHYNDFMETAETECTACHTPHKSPYYVDPANVPGSSYTQLLRVETALSVFFYNKDDEVAGNAFCLKCHGPNTTTLNDNAGPGTYGSTAGNHTYALNAVHNETVVYTNNDSHATNPGIQCEACHNKHASAVDKLIDYRGSGTTTTENDQAGLCYKCHRAGTSENRVAAGYAAPYAWNGRDVFAQFAKRVAPDSGPSSHPMTAGSGRWTPASDEVFSQDTDTEFASDTLSQTLVNAADGDGSVVLNQQSIVTPIASNPYVMVMQAATDVAAGATRSYLAGDAAWNEDFNPTDIGTNPGSGANSTTKNGIVFAMQGSSNVMRTYTPPANAGTGTWGTTANVWQTANIGSDMAFDSTDNYIWALAGGYTPTNVNGGTNIRRTTNFSGTTLAWYDTTGYDGPAFRTGGTDRRLGAGATLSWVPANGARPERLYVVNRDGANTRDGLLYYYDNPDAATGGTNWVSTTHVFGSTGTASDTGSRMAYFRIGTTDYIYALRGAANLEYLLQLANTTAAAGTLLDNGTANPWNANVGDGCSLLWNGDSTQAGFRLYATRGGNAGTSFKVATWNGTALVWSDGPALSANSTTGTYLAYATADPADPSTLQYYASGTVTTAVDILPVAGAEAWGTVAWTETLPANTDISVKVQGWNGSAWVDLTTSGTSPIDISGYSIAAYPKLKLIGTLTTTAPATSTPVLTSWTVTSTKPVWQASGSVTCVNCHNTHTVARGGATAWDMTRVSDPDSTKDAYTGTPTQFCLECHDESAPTTALNDADILVPYSVGFRTFDSPASPFWPGWNKKAAGVSFENSAHATTAIPLLDGDIGCQTCHDPHASDNARLTAYSYDQDGAAPGQHSGTVDRSSTSLGNTSAYDEEKLCYACHDTQSGALCTGGACHPGADIRTLNAKTPIEQTYGHPVGLTDRHSDLEGASDLGPAAADRHAECADCHDPHAARAGLHPNATSTTVDTKSSIPGEALRGASGIIPSYGTAFSGKTGEDWFAMNAATGFTAERMDGDFEANDDFEAYVCLKCHSSYSGQPTTDMPRSDGTTYNATDLALEFNPSNQSEHNVMGQQVGMEGSFTVNGVAYAMPLPADTAFLKTGWTSNSPVTCTDCHSNTTAGQARGPHGSSTPWMMATGYVTWTATTDLGNMGTTVICAKCHQNLLSANSAHNKHETRADCWDCHITIPHGWKRPRLLARTEDPEPYERGDCLTGSGIALRVRTGPNDWRDESVDCAGGCDGRHNYAGPFWP